MSPHDSTRHRPRAAAVVCLAALALCTVSPPDAAAHGSLPAVLGLASDADDGPRVLRLTVGMAVREDDGGWTWACPTLWGGPEAPLASGTDALGTLFGGATDAFRLRAAPLDLEPLGVPELASTRVRDLELDADGSGVWILASSAEPGTPTALWHLDADGARLVLGLEASWHDLAVHQGELVLVRPDDLGALVVGRVDPAAPAQPELAFPLEPAFGAPGVRSDGTDLYLTMRIGSRHELWRVEADGTSTTFLLGVDDATIHGPVRDVVPGALLLVADGALVQLAAPGGAPEVLDESREYTCLESRRAGAAGMAVACTVDTLYAVDALGVGELLFALEALRAPPSALLGQADALRCDAEWLDFRDDAELTEASSDTEATETTDDAADTALGDAAADTAAGDGASDPDCSCRTLRAAPPHSPASAGALLALLALLALVWRTRQKSPGSPANSFARRLRVAKPPPGVSPRTVRGCASERTG